MPSLIDFGAEATQDEILSTRRDARTGVTRGGSRRSDGLVRRRPLAKSSRREPFVLFFFSKIVYRPHAPPREHGTIRHRRTGSNGRKWPILDKIEMIDGSDDEKTTKTMLAKELQRHLARLQSITMRTGGRVVIGSTAGMPPDRAG